MRFISLTACASRAVSSASNERCRSRTVGWFSPSRMKTAWRSPVLKLSDGHDFKTQPHQCQELFEPLLLLRGHRGLGLLEQSECGGAFDGDGVKQGGQQGAHQGFGDGHINSAVCGVEQRSKAPQAATQDQGFPGIIATHKGQANQGNAQQGGDDIGGSHRTASSGRLRYEQLLRRLLPSDSTRC